MITETAVHKIERAIQENPDAERVDTHSFFAIKVHDGTRGEARKALRDDFMTEGNLTVDGQEWELFLQ